MKRVASWVKRKQGLKNFDLYHHKGNIELSHIEVPKGSRKQGKGSKAMSMLNKFADRHGKRVWLTTAQKDSRSGTTSKGRLEKFYKRHGYVPNRGRKKDYSLSMYASMYRNPKPKS